MRALLGCAFYAAVLGAHAQFPLVRAFELRAGSQRPRVQAIAQDSIGLVWAASDLGLLRSDGHSTELVARIQGITALATVGSSAVIGTAAGRIVRCNGLRCDTLLRDTALAAARIIHLVPAPDGTLWMGTQRGGLFRLRDGAVIGIRGGQGLPDDHINGLALLPDGRLAVATDQGIVLVKDAAAGQRMSEAEGAPDNLVLCLTADADGSIWAGTDRGGVFRWKPGEQPERVAQPWAYGAVRAIAEADGMLWAATASAGLVAIDLQLKRGVYRPETRTAPEPRGLLRASDEAIWWCDGSDRLHRADPAVLVAAEHEGIGLRDITAIAIDHQERIWFAKGHRLFRHDARFSEESRIAEVPVALSPMTPIVSLACAADGTLWAATFGSGAVAIAPDGAVRRITERDGLSNDNVLRARATEDAIVFSTLEGITVLESGGLRQAGAEAGFVFDALADRDALYMATDGRGVRTIRGKALARATRTDRTYYALHRFADGRIWAAGPGTGFCLLGAGGEACHLAGAPPFDGDLYALTGAAGRLIAFGSTGGPRLRPAHRRGHGGRFRLRARGRLGRARRRGRGWARRALGGVQRGPDPHRAASTPFRAAHPRSSHLGQPRWAARAVRCAGGRAARPQRPGHRLHRIALDRSRGAAVPVPAAGLQRAHHRDPRPGGRLPGASARPLPLPGQGLRGRAV